MLSIGELSKRTGVKIPTIRYYETCGILAEPGRSEGGQRRYDGAALERLAFVRHARDLGFSLEQIKALIGLQEHPDRACAQAGEIAEHQLSDVRSKIARLLRLEVELQRISEGCSGKGAVAECYVLRSLADHGQCSLDH
mgnify:FL=1